jgi:CspA family cold shock protein
MAADPPRVVAHDRDNTASTCSLKGFPVPTGSVVRFDRRRGYGFVQPDDGGEDVFVHQNNIAMEGFRFLEVGEKVSYELEVGEKGMKAVSVALTEPRVERPRGYDDRDDRGPRDDRDQGGYREERPAFGGAPRAHAPRGDDRGDRSGRKLERLISLLVAKGVIAPGEMDGLENAVKSADAAQG